ncbi:hypothetical protein KHQ81_12940 [Mycoplasmatota bacterium]|nr:hypothetical protein KHQ81_12940 [Mycoplasmatota bacterium]
MWKWILCVVIIILACVYIYRSADTTPVDEDREQIRYLQELSGKHRRKKGKFYEKVKR